MEHTVIRQKTTYALQTGDSDRFAEIIILIFPYTKLA